MSGRRCDSVSLRLFGAFQLAAGPDRSIFHLKNKRARGVLTYLAMQPDCSAGRETLSNMFWPDCPDANARHSLRQCLMSLRKELESVAPDLIRVENNVVSLDRDSFDADARALLAVDANTDPRELNTILKSFSADFLSDLRINEDVSSWILDIRRQLAEKVEEILRRIDREPGAGDVLPSAVSAARALVQADPFSEDFRRLLISLTTRAYGRGRGLTEYRSFAEFLRGEDAGEPNPDLLDIVRDTEKPELRIETAPQPAEQGPGMTVTQEAAAKAAFEERTGQAAAMDDSVAQKARDDSHRVAPPPGSLPDRSRWSDLRKRVAAAALVMSALAAFVWSAGSLLDVNHAEATSLAGLFAGAKDDPILRSIPVVVRPFTSTPGDDGSAEKLRELIYEHVAKVPVVRIQWDAPPQAHAYRLNGRIRQEFGQPVLSVHLSAPDGSRVWHEKFSLGEATSFTWDIAKRIGREIEIVLIRAEAQAAIARKDVGFGAMLLAARAIQLRGHAGYADPNASRLLEEALKVDDDSALALAGVAGQLVASQAHAFRRDRKLEEKAESYLRKAISLDPNLPLAHFYMGLLHKSRGDSPLAIASFNRTLELNPSFAPAYANLGHALMLLGRMDEGFENIRYAMRISPNDAFLALWSLFAGEIEFERGNTAAAVDFFRTALTRAPHLARAYGWIAGAYEAAGDSAAAAASMRQFGAMLGVRQPADLIERLRSAPEGGLQRSRPKLYQAVEAAARQYLSAAATSAHLR